MSLYANRPNHNWNYTKPNNPGYRDTLVATVVGLQETQARKFTSNGTPGAPDYWDNGDPKMNVRMIMVDGEGKYVTFTFLRRGRTHKKMEQVLNISTPELIGKTIQIQTAPCNPETGQVWGPGNPRQFEFAYVDGGPFQAVDPMPHEYTVPVLMCDEAVSGGQINQQVQQPQTQQQPMYQPQPMVQPMQPMQQQPMYQPTVTMQQQQPMQTMPAQPAQVQPQQYQPAQQVQAQPTMQQQPAGMVQPMMPAGMDPQIAEQMQQMGAVNVQPVDPYSDESLPF